MKRILIVDDHAIVGAGLQQFLLASDEFSIAGHARTGREAINAVDEGEWDLVLLDIGLPDIHGIEVLKRLRRTHPGLPVLIFSMYAEDDYAAAAFEAGAIGYLPKDCEPVEILAAIRRACAGERYLSPGLSDKLLHGQLPRAHHLPHESLSHRETEVMFAISRGMPLKAIADSLHLSPKTVSTYRARVLEKLDMQSNAELTRYVMANKLGQ
ncbi:MAG: response regulator transcription factor [Rhodocyclaceae bacterium]|nr:response regulator transcription factor [Rhodocyclaceae bacterium]